MTTSDDVASATRVIAASPEKIFALLADPRQHRAIDGSGTVRDTEAGAERLELGSEFAMSMKMGISYSMTNTVIEYEENRRIAWQTRPTYSWAEKLGGGRIWRYELEPVEGGTRVTEVWDIAQEVGLTKWLVARGREHTIGNMETTLARIEEILTA
jgi:uncharacterized protein YndB with AHSA1/START domain